MSIYGNHEHRGEDAFIKAQFEIARLKAEVERLEARIEYVDNLANRYALDDVRSQAQVERLTKAGDAAIEHLRWQGGKHTKEVIIPAWNAAKEGNPHA